ncbi:MAG: hypothetical protein P1V51_15090 [Deltaproteobacteria bacterium]|nr:hypothetical protein [Deltaproteobacteria bacterium]
MRSERRCVNLLVICALVFAGCAISAPGDFDGSGGDRDLGAFFDDAWWPATPFVAGTSLIPLQQPLRCHRFPNDATRVAFTWTPSGQRRVYAAIFADEPTREGSVVSPSPIWTWMTGGTRSDVGRLHWDDGVEPGDRDLPDWNTTAPPLAPGDYWFVIWAWDESRNLVASSEARYFLVEDLGGRSELGACCDHLTAEMSDGGWTSNALPVACAPELPPEGGGVCPTADGGGSEWPCYCDYLAAGAVCE